MSAKIDSEDWKKVFNFVCSHAKCATAQEKSHEHDASGDRQEKT